LFTTHALEPILGQIVMGSISIWHWLIVFFVLAAVAIPTAKILGKAGFSKWWTILAFIPWLNLAALWVFAFVQWPATPDRR